MNERSNNRLANLLKRAFVIVSLLAAGLGASASAPATPNVSLAWDAAEGAAGYFVYTSTDGTNYSSAIDAGASTNIVLSGLVPGTVNIIT